MQFLSRHLPGFSRIIEALPLMLIAGLTGFSIVTIILLLCGALYTWLIIVLGVPIALTLAFLVFKYAKGMPRPGGIKERRIVDLVVLLGVLLWGGFNMQYTSQHVITDRDPATYANTAVWLSKHHDLNIQPSYEEFGENEAVTHGSAGFAVDEGTVRAQGAHLLPALLGIGGRVVGESELLRLGPLIGVMALLAVYVFARMFMLPRWALLATAITAATLPMIFFSRGTYSEPLMMAFVFGSLALLWLAQTKRSFFLWAMAGLVAGVATMTRIDAYLVIAAFALILSIWVILAKKDEHIQRLQEVGIFFLGVLVPSIVGWLDIVLLSNPYYIAHAKLIWQCLALIGGVLLLGAIVTFLSWKTHFLRIIDKYTKGWRGYAIAFLLIILGVFLASRPMWMMITTNSVNDIVASIQIAEGDTVMGRSYAEQTVNWLSWYLGTAVLIVGFIGVIRVSYLFIKGRSLLLGAGLITVGVTTALYLWSPSITPDQLWASRRFLPVTIPGFAIFAAFAFYELELRLLKKAHLYIKVGFFVIISVLSLTLPLAASSPFLKIREKTQASVVENTCSKLPKDSAIIWVGMARLTLVQPTRTFCDLPVAGYKNGDVLTKKNLSEIAQSIRSQGRVPLIGGYAYQGSIFEVYGQIDNVTFLNPVEYNVIQSTLDEPPNISNEEQTVIMLGEINPDGSLKSLN